MEKTIHRKRNTDGSYEKMFLLAHIKRSANETILRYNVFIHQIIKDRKWHECELVQSLCRAVGNVYYIANAHALWSISLLLWICHMVMWTDMWRLLFASLTQQRIKNYLHIHHRGDVWIGDCTSFHKLFTMSHEKREKANLYILMWNNFWDIFVQKGTHNAKQLLNNFEKEQS